MKIESVHATLVSHLFERRPNAQSRGSAFKRDLVLVRVVADNGVVGYGEAYHGHAGSAVAEIVNTTVRDAVVGESAHDTEGIWHKLYSSYVAGAGLGAGFIHAMSGIDMALWDVRGKALGVPVYTLLGGERRPFRAYAGGLSLGFQEPAMLVDEVARLRESAGYTAVKLRLGDTVENDLLRVRRVREEFGSELEIMCDANLGCSYADTYRLLPGLAECDVSWFEEPFPRDDIQGYVDLRSRSGVSIAGGENLYGRHEFKHWFERRALDVVQPDCSKTGGVSELKKVGDMAAAYHLRLAPHTSHSRLNHAATLHVMAALPAAYIFEADATGTNRFSEELIRAPLDVVDGWVSPPSEPGLGVDVDEARLADFPGLPGSPYPGTRPS